MGITELSLVEIEFLMNPKKIDLAEAFESIIRELIVKKVIATDKKQKFPNSRSKKPQKYDIFFAGDNYKGYEAKKYEENLLRPFTEYGELYFKILTNFVLKKYSVPSSFIESEIRHTLKKEGYVNEIPVLKSFGMWGITSKAKDELQQVEEYLAQMMEKIHHCLPDKQENFIKIIQEMGVLVFLIHTKDHHLWEEIIHMLKKVERNKPLGKENDLSEYLKAALLEMKHLHHH